MGAAAVRADRLSAFPTANRRLLPKAAPPACQTSAREKRSSIESARHEIVTHRNGMNEEVDAGGSDPRRPEEVLASEHPESDEDILLEDEITGVVCAGCGSAFVADQCAWDMVAR